jgi:hypothetical protein
MIRLNTSKKAARQSRTRGRYFRVATGRRSGKSLRWIARLPKDVAGIAPHKRKGAQTAPCGARPLREILLGTLLRSFVQFLFESVAFSDVQRANLLELIQQLLRHRCVVTVTFLFGDDLTFVGNMPLTFGDVRLACSRCSSVMARSGMVS